MLDLRRINRTFEDREVLRDVSFSVTPGRITGLVGANGAGKTTLMRIVLGVLAPSSGEVRWRGRAITRRDRSLFGYLPEERGLYPKQAVIEQLVYFGRLHGLSQPLARERVVDLLQRLDLQRHGTDRLDSLSLGNQQRVQVAAALVHDPVALVLDEPFSGLDPLAVDAMADLLKERAADGVAIVFSSHQLDLVERLCDDLVILREGQIVSRGNTHDLRAGPAMRYRLVVDGDLGWVRGLAGLRIHTMYGGEAEVDVVVPGAEQALLQEAVARTRVRELTPIVPTLTEKFREVIR